MGKNWHAILTQCLQWMLRPIIRFCLRTSLGLGDLVEAAKVVFIQVAVEQMEDQGEKVNISRITAATGVHRKDAVRIHREGDIIEDASPFMGRVIGQWMGDKRFLTKNKAPRVLSYDGEDSEFYTLVNSVGVDLKPGTVLFALEKAGAIEKTKNGLKLKVKAYIPRKNPTESFKLMAHDIEDFMLAVLDNIYSEGAAPNIHVTTVYDNIDEKDLKKIREWFNKQCSSLHRRAEQYLARYDLDINPNPKKEGGHRVLLGSFTRTQ